MKSFLIILSTIALLGACLTQACSDSNAVMPPLDRAEEAFEQGHIVQAQTLCDSLVLGDSFGDLNVNELCRLSLLLIRLSENSADAGPDMAFAAKAYDAACERNADSAAIFLNSVDVEDQGRFALISALHEAHSKPAVTDTIFYETDTIYFNEQQ